MMHGFEFGHLWRTLEKWIAPRSELPTKGFNREQGPPSPGWAKILIFGNVVPNDSGHL